MTSVDMETVQQENREAMEKDVHLGGGAHEMVDKPNVRVTGAGCDATEVTILPAIETASEDFTKVEETSHSAFAVFNLAYKSLGIIYGDIGTSPLYVFASTFDTPPEDKRDVVGAMSLIFWSLTLIALIKYVMIVLSCDDNGEGGTSALYTLLCRHVKISLLNSQHKSDRQLTNYTRSLNRTHTNLKATLERSERLHKMLLIVAMCGSCMVIGDGVLTPAISVLSAIEGIQVVAPVLRQNMVVLITCVILSGLFLLQSTGTHRVGALFAPIVLLWFILITGVGIYNMVIYKPDIFKACGPHHGISFLVRNQKNGWIMLGGIVLSITGTEAMFADLGHFSQRSIQIAFAGVVYPSLVLGYFGQAAYLTAHPEDVSSSFFKSVPKPLHWPSLVIATLATIVASQAMISGAFSVIKQALALGCFPRVKVIHTSKSARGQIYIPEVNYALMVCCIAVVVGFQKTTAIGNAYGIAVVSVMVITTCLVALVIVIVWQQSMILGLLFFCFFGSIEAVYLSSVLSKVAMGGWVPLVFAGFLLSIMCTWQFGTSEKYKFDIKNMVHIDQLGELVADSRITRVPGIGLFYSETVSGIPPTFSHFIRNIPAIHQVMVFVCIKHVPVPNVLPNERVLIRALAVKNFYQCVMRYGYNEAPSAGQDFDNLIVEKIVDLLRKEKVCVPVNLSKSSSKVLSPKNLNLSTSVLEPGAPINVHGPQLPTSEIQLPLVVSQTAITETETEIMLEEVSYIKRAKDKGVVYVIGSTEVQAREGSSWYKHFVLDIAYCLLRKNCRSSVIMLNIPHTRLIEVGMIYAV